MRNFFGFFVYDNNASKIEGRWNRQYFRNSYDYRDNQSWNRWRTYILPYDIPDTDSDGQPDAQNHMTNGKEWIWPANASCVALRFGSCHYGTGRLVPNRARRHDPDPAGVASFWGPRV